MTDRSEIEAAIPHREPFLFVDRVVERADDRILCEWRVPPDGDWFRGHYPGHPVTPGVLLCEHVFQCAALLISLATGEDARRGPEGGVPVLTRIGGARFRRMVAPGETVASRVTVDERVGPAWYLSARTTLGGPDGPSVLRLSFVVTHSGATAAVQEALE